MNEINMYGKFSIINVKNKLNIEEKYAKGDKIYVNCPFCHNYSNGSMKLNVSNDTYYCPNCGENGYAISLYAKLNHINNKKAYRELLSKEADLRTSLIEIRKCVRKSDEEISLVYEYFLKMLDLNARDTKKLIDIGFTKENIVSYGFKSIPQNEKEKQDICSRLKNMGFDLSGVPGFYINSKMKWTFKSHKGIFIPVIDNTLIKGIRIHLERKYKLETTDIWFSSSQEYKGADAKNNLMILLPDKERKLEIIGNEQDEKILVVASEMMLAYRLFSIYNQITIGIPNYISKKQAKFIMERYNIKKIYMYLDRHTLLTDSSSIYKNLLNNFDDVKKKIIFELDDKNMVKGNKVLYRIA